MTSATLIKKLSLIDLEQNREQFIRDLSAGLRDCGFVVLRDHGIPKSMLDKAYEQIEQLFSLPLETKLKYDSGRGGHRGYTAFGREKAAGRTAVDLKEFWHVGPEVQSEKACENQSGIKNQWPSELPEFRHCFTQLYQQLENIGLSVLEAIEEGLATKQPYLKEIAINGDSICRLLHYPPVNPDSIGADTDTHEVSMRAAPHADINLLTLLIGASDSGLELLDKNGIWVPVESHADEIVLDTGDMMARVTNNQLPSTVHRVINQSQHGGSRYSMPFFLHPRDDAVLTCLPECQDGNEAPDIAAGEFLEQRLRENGLIADS